MRLGSTGALIVLALLGLAACSSAPGPPPSPRPAPPGTRAPQPGSPRTDRGRGGVSTVSRRVVDLASAQVASPYRYGGADPSGFDCSGLTSYVFRRAGFRLPRTTVEQSKVGHWTAPDELAPGDLVFFGDHRSKLFHVGLVVSAPGEPLAMIHASSSRGVVKTEVTKSAYWLERLRFGRRVLPD